MKPLLAAALVLAAGAMPGAVLAQNDQAPKDQARSHQVRGNWLAEVERTPVSHLVGNPAAPVTLTEYLSYTCPDCRNFAVQGEPLLKLGPVSEGSVRFEYRHTVGNVVDLTLAMLARCGAPGKFPANHEAIMAAQPQFLSLAKMAMKSQTDRWQGGDAAARRAVASDLNLYAIFERRGYSQVELDRCLADQALADTLQATAQQDRTETGVRYTPSFAVNDRLLENVHGWDALRTALGAGPDAAPSAQ